MYVNMKITGNLGKGLYNSILSELDNSRENMKRIFNPPTGFYSIGNQNTTKQDNVKSSINSSDIKGQSGSYNNIRAAGSLSRNAAGNTAVTSGVADNPSMQVTAGKTGANPQAYRVSRTNSVQVSEQKRQAAHSDKGGIQLDFSDGSLLNGIIMAEILGKPKYLRKGRW